MIFWRPDPSNLLGKTKIVIIIQSPIDLAHNTPVVVNTNSSTFKGFVDRSWQFSNQGGSKSPCSQCRTLIQNPFCLIIEVQIEVSFDQ